MYIGSAKVFETQNVADLLRAEYGGVRSSRAFGRGEKKCDVCLLVCSSHFSTVKFVNVRSPLSHLNSESILGDHAE